MGQEHRGNDFTIASTCTDSLQSHFSTWAQRKEWRDDIEKGKYMGAAREFDLIVACLLAMYGVGEGG